MAILFEDKYHKIIKTTNNFIDNTTEIEMNVYASEEDREHEKKIEQRIKIFKGNVYNLLEQNMINLIEKTNKIKPVNEIDDAEEFFKEHPEIEKEYKIVQAKQDEGLDIADKITTIDIDINKLQFKDLWIEQGLDEELCKKVNYLGTSMVGLDGIRTNELSKLYDAVKERLVGEIIDC